MQKELPKHYHNVNFLNIFQTQTFFKTVTFKPIIMEFSTQNSTFFRIYPKLVCI